MLKNNDDGMDIPRQRFLWGVWSGLVIVMAALVVFLALQIVALRSTVQGNQLGLAQRAWVADQVALDVAGLQSSVQMLATKAAAAVPTGGTSGSAENTEFAGFDRAAMAILTGRVAEFVDQSRPLVEAVHSENITPEYPSAAELIDAQQAFLTSYGTQLSNADWLRHAQDVRKLAADVQQIAQLQQALVVDVLHSQVMQDNSSQTAVATLLTRLQRSAWAILAGFLGLGIVGVLMLIALNHQRKTVLNTLTNMNSVIRASRDAVFLVTRDMAVVGMGRSGGDLFGYSEDEVQGRSLLDFFANDRSEFEQFVGAIRKDSLCNDSAADLRIELNARRRDGTTFPANARFCAADENSDSIAYVISVADMSTQVDRELSLMQARNEALQAERAKSRFLAAMSHEMRTPLNGVLASLDLLRETTDLGSRQDELISIIERSGNDALEQVENVLELTRLDALADTAIAVAPFSPVGQLRDIVEANQSRAQQQNNELLLECQVPENLEVVGSAILFRQIIHNFISNAVKFTSNGQVHARLQAVDLGDEVEFTVVIQDTGIGIEPADLDRIFHNFETIRDSYSHYSSGTGVGLSIAKHSADLMDGKIDVHSTPGQGSSFTLVVRWSKIAETAPLPSDWGRIAPTGQGAMDVLVVEDNAINRQMLVDMLKAKGHRVVEAMDGLEGVAAGRDQAFDLILMDISMPKLDGVGATRMLRHMGKSRKSPIVAVTAHSQPEHMREFLAAGMDRVLTKPLRMTTLEHLFEDLAGDLGGADLGGSDVVAAPEKQLEPVGQSAECTPPTASPALQKVAVEPAAAQSDVASRPILSQVGVADTEDTVRGATAEAPADPTPPEDPKDAVAMKEDAMAEQLIDKEVFDGLVDMLGGDSVGGYLTQFENDAIEMLPKYTAAVAAGDFATARAEAHKCAGGAAVIGAGRVHEVLQGMTHSADDADVDKSTALSATLLDLTQRTMAEMRGLIG